MGELKLEPLLYWVKERELIRQRKEVDRAPPPWTDDAILRTFRFCNVCRKDDRVSRWLLQHVLTVEQLKRVGWVSFIQFTALCRWINWPPTLLALLERDVWGPKIQWEKIINVLDERKHIGKVWTGAYMITARGAELGQSKSSFIVETVVRRALRGHSVVKLRKATTSNSRAQTWSVLTQLHNWGSFMSGQVVDDWTWTPVLWRARDNLTWAPQGPGSLRGLNRLLGRPKRYPYTQEEWCQLLRQLLHAIISELGADFRRMTLHDVQNCLCEVDKYLRVVYGEGSPRSVYRPETEYTV